jgi:N6-adenosine-specific RNA methylase IME4
MEDQTITFEQWMHVSEYIEKKLDEIKIKSKGNKFLSLLLSLEKCYLDLSLQKKKRGRKKKQYTNDSNDPSQNKKKNYMIRERRPQNKIDIEDFNCIKEKYHIIVMDPPWSYDRSVGSGCAENHYDTLPIHEIKKLPIWQIAEKDCLLLLWVTNPQDKKWHDLIEHWKFEYKTWGFVWIKVSKDNVPLRLLGNYARLATEQCYILTRGDPRKFSPKVLFETPDEQAEAVALLAIKGRPLKAFGAPKKGPARSVSNVMECTEDNQLNKEIDVKEEYDADDARLIDLYFGDKLKVIRAPPIRDKKDNKIVHSKKPMHELTKRLNLMLGENYHKLKKIELFARSNTEGWDSWGDEAGKYDDKGNQISDPKNKKIVSEEVEIEKTETKTTKRKMKSSITNDSEEIETKQTTITFKKKKKKIALF